MFLLTIKFLKIKMFFEVSLFNEIDTASVYKEEFGYQSKKNSFEGINNLKEYKSSSFRGYYKFYSNGCVDVFSFQDFEQVIFSSINPNFNGQRGIFYSKENVIKLYLFTIAGYSFKRDYGIMTSILKVKGDKSVISIGGLVDGFYDDQIKEIIQELNKKGIEVKTK